MMIRVRSCMPFISLVAVAACGGGAARLASAPPLAPVAGIRRGWSARRIMNASPDTSASTAFQIQRLGQQLFGHLAPNGWPETGDQWINAGSPLDRQVDGVVDQLLGGNVSPETRSILFKGQNPLAAAGAPAPVRPSLRDLLGIALGSPEFQRR